MRFIDLNPGEYLYVEKGHLSHSTLSHIDRLHNLKCEYDEKLCKVRSDFHTSPFSRLNGGTHSTEAEAVIAVMKSMEKIEVEMKAFGAKEVLFMSYQKILAYSWEGEWLGDWLGSIVGTEDSHIYMAPFK